MPTHAPTQHFIQQGHNLPLSKQYKEAKAYRNNIIKVVVNPNPHGYGI
jgi:hypothetical protein